ncbi:MAG TPA: hypothetical protein VF875_12065 [Anaeromyxobacter sp.]
MKGIPFVVEPRFVRAISGLTVDVQDLYGREALVAYHASLSGTCEPEERRR